ncbi:hypothetical protein [Nannocystis pusilla]|uniref:hypothetical protein n=1 Tax=Nannocystis pusilla TaxID=889268 RepID=UPI003B822826
MSSTQAPVWAFHAEAIDGVGDTHLPTGIHVRALPSARLGLPAAPLVVYRAVLDLAKFKDIIHDGGVTWIDSHGAPQTVPFDVTPDNPVYGYFPAPEVFWAELLADPGDKLDPPKEPPYKDIGELAKGGFKTEEDLKKFTDTLGPILAEQQSPAGVLRFEALTSTGVGVAPILSRSTERYAIAAWTIQQVRVVGKGTVKGIRWLDSAALKKAQLSEQLWQVWSLPVKPKARYHPTGNAESEAKDRVHRGGATRQPMYVAHTAMTPGTAPSAIPDDAMARVDQVSSEIDRWLDLVLNDTSVETWQVTDQQDVDGKDGDIRVPVEPFILAGGVDPDVGHWLGFGDVDLKPPAGVGSLVFYRVRGCGAGARSSGTRPSSSHSPRPCAPTPRRSRRASPSSRSSASCRPRRAVRRPARDRGRVRRHAARAAAGDDLRQRGGPRLARRAAAARRPPGAAPARQPVPPARRGRARGDRRPRRPHPARLSEVRPDHDRRAAAAGAAAAAGGVAADRSRRARRGPLRRARRARGRRVLPPRRGRLVRPLVAVAHPAGPGQAPHPADAPGDRDLSAAAHGRIAGAGRPAALHDHGADPDPRTSELPPGGARLARLDLVETFEGSPTTTVSYLLANPAPATIESLPPAPDMLLVVRDGPDLPRCGSKKVTYTARWIDELGLVSPDALPAQRTIVDPRPPRRRP